MKERQSDNIGQDPFKLQCSLWRDRVIMDSIKLFDNARVEEFGPPSVYPDDVFNPLLFGDPRGSAKDMERIRLFLARLAFGLIGGVALIAPILLMVFYSNQTTQVVTTSVATILFALGMACYEGPGASPYALVGVTAAYAAVLVVFVGAST